MLTFIISFVLTSIACLCIFKKDFWENRYIVLLINGCVALIATLIVNFSVRGNLETKTEVTMIRAMKTFYLPEAVYLKSVSYHDTIDTLQSVRTKLSLIKGYDWYGDHNAKEFLRDTAKKQIPVTIVLYTYGKKDLNKRVGVYTSKGNQSNYNLEYIYFVPSTADSIAYVSEKKQYYDTKPNNWISGFSIPRKSSITILHVPPTEYAMIPDSLIRPLPF